MKYLVPLGRVLYSAIFCHAPRPFHGKDYRVCGKPRSASCLFAVPLSGAIVFVGALSILLGYKAPLSAPGW